MNNLSKLPNNISDRTQWQEWISKALYAKTIDLDSTVLLHCNSCNDSFTKSARDVLGENSLRTSQGCPKCYGGLSANSNFIKNIISDYK